MNNIITLASQEWVTGFTNGLDLSKWEPKTTLENVVITRGRLYNWYAATDSRNIAPEGWHVPTLAEFTSLINYFGGESVAGGKLKETGFDYWNQPNSGATNESDFTARAAGLYDSWTNHFEELNTRAFFWTTSGETYDYASHIDIYSSGTTAYIRGASKNHGGSIRLIKDDSNNTGTVTDADGNVYNTISINNQVWTLENLITTKYRNGDPISNNLIGETGGGAYSDYNLDQSISFSSDTITSDTVIAPKNGKRIETNIISGLNAYDTVVSVNNKIGNIIPSRWEIIGNTVDPDHQSPALGTTFQGGRVGYLLQEGDHGYDANYWKGIIVGQQSDNYMNFSSAVNSGVIHSEIGYGHENTLALISALGADAIAANYCTGVTTSGYTDWFLPSVYEIFTCWENLQFTPNNYYSSTESSTDGANKVEGLSMLGGMTSLDKVPSAPPYNYVLPCRYFSVPKVFINDTTHIRPKDNLRLHASYIDGLTPQNISLGKTGVNTSPSPERFRWISDKLITNVLLTDNCSSISVQIGGTTYNETTLIGATLPANTDLIILDLAIQTGYDNANAIIIF